MQRINLTFLQGKFTTRVVSRQIGQSNVNYTQLREISMKDINFNKGKIPPQ